MIRKTSILFILILSLVFSFKGVAQIKKAEKNFQFYHYSKAIPFLLKAVESDKMEIKYKAIPMLAHCYRLTNNTGEARAWYEKAVEIPGSDLINFFYLGQAYRGLGLYEEAAAAFLTFKTAFPDSLDAEKYYNYSVEIQDWLGLPPMANVKNVETVNTRYSDFGPAIYKSGIVFTSDRKKDQLDDTYGWTNFNYLNLHYSEPEYYRNYWSPMKPASLMEDNYNQTFHDGPATFTSDFNRVYVTKTTEKDPKKESDNIQTSLLKIFYADIIEGKKLSFRELPFNSKAYSVAHPTLSENNQQIIFSSDMPGGYGGSDLYMSTLTDDNWSEPLNLGEKINTRGNEVFPCWANDSVLFFASEDHMGYGGLDIFRSFRINDSTWTEPENLKAPINTPYDDFGIVFSDELEAGLFSSNRPEGKGSDDIYAFRNLSYGKPSLEISGRVIDVNNNPVGGATVFLFDPESNTAKVLKSDENGVYSDEAYSNHSYVAKAMKDGYDYDCTSFRTPAGEIVTYQVTRDLVLLKFEVNQVFQIENIYYDLDKWYIREDAEPELDKIVAAFKQYPISAELSSHTDCRASDEYNRELSQKRAESAIRYIILQGVAPSRITAKGYGETQLVNKCADGVDCTEEEHQANRRTEFKITSVGSSANVNSFDLSKYKEGSVIDANTLESNFFVDCTAKKKESNNSAYLGVKQAPKAEVRIQEIKEKAVDKKNDTLVEEKELIKTVYRVQLIATVKDLTVGTHFSDIDDIIQANGISVLKIGNLNKYQVGNFETVKAANELKNILRQKGYNDCFVINITKKVV